MKNYLLFTSLFVLLFSISLSAQESKTIEFSGFTSAFYKNEFNLGQVELDLERHYNKGYVRADVEYVNNGSNEYSGRIEQAYLAYHPFETNPGSFIEINLGRFNAPHGFESIDPSGLYQFSWGLISDHMPSNLTGVSFSFGGWIFENHYLSALTYLAEDWNNDPDYKEKSGSVKVVYKYKSIFSTEFSFIEGGLKPIQGDHTVSVDFIATLQPLPRLLFAYNYFSSGESVEDNINLSFDRLDGHLFMTNYILTDWTNLTFRYDLLNDHMGLSTDTRISSKRSAVTVSQFFRLGQNMGCRWEYRKDYSSKTIFDSKKSADYLAFAVLYKF